MHAAIECFPSYTLALCSLSYTTIGLIVCSDATSVLIIVNYRVCNDLWVLLTVTYCVNYLYLLAYYTETYVRL